MLTSLYLADSKKDLYIARLVRMTTTIMMINSSTPPSAPPITAPTGVSSFLHDNYYNSNYNNLFTYTTGAATSLGIHVLFSSTAIELGSQQPNSPRSSSSGGMMVYPGGSLHNVQLVEFGPTHSAQ